MRFFLEQKQGAVLAPPVVFTLAGLVDDIAVKQNL